MSRFRLPPVALLGASLTAAACSSSGVTETSPSAPPLIAGYYRADTTGARAAVDNAGPDLHAGDLVLRGDGTYALGVLVVPGGGGNSFSSGTWTQAGTRVTFTPTAGAPVRPWTLGNSESALVGGDSIQFARPYLRYSPIPGVANVDTVAFVPGSGRFRTATPTGSAVAAGQYALRVVNGHVADTAGFVVGYYQPAPGRVDSTIRIAADTLTFTDGVFVRNAWSGNTQFAIAESRMTGDNALFGAYDATASTVVLRWYATPAALTSVGYKAQFDSLAVHGDTLIRRSRDGQHPEYGLIDQRYVRVR